MDVTKLADGVFETVRAYVAKALEPLSERLQTLEARESIPGPPGEKGADGRDGSDGKDGRDGQDGKDGRDGLDGQPGERGLDGKDGANGIDGKDGESVTVEQVLEAVSPVMEAKMAMWALDFERRAQGVLERAIDRMPKPKDGRDGKDGLGFDDLQMDYDGARTFTFSYVQGDKEKAFSFVVPMLLDRGVYKEGADYEQGDVVTWGGSMWIAQADTKAKPGQSDEWRLSVKKGRDGKDFT